MQEQKSREQGDTSKTKNYIEKMAKISMYVQKGWAIRNYEGVEWCRKKEKVAYVMSVHVRDKQTEKEKKAPWV